MKKPRQNARKGPQVPRGATRGRYPMFPAYCRHHGLPAPASEVRFHPTRKWLFDFAWPEQKVALEVDGGVWSRGRHTRGAGFLRDMEKINTATVMGWRVVRCTPQTLTTRDTVAMLAALLTPPTP